MLPWLSFSLSQEVQGGSNMTGTDLCVNKPHCAAAVRLVYMQISPGHIWTTLYTGMYAQSAPMSAEHKFQLSKMQSHNLDI